MSKLKNRIVELEKENESLKKYIQELENKLNSKIPNERNAGRKKKLSDQEIEEIKMYRIQNKTIKELSQMFNVSVGLIHKIINSGPTNHISTPITTPPVIEEPTEKIAKIDMSLRVENNNKFVRGRSKVIESIERYLTWSYKIEKPYPKGCDYIIYVPYTTVEDLKNTVYDIISEMDMDADSRNCFIECDLRCEELDLYW